MVYLSWLLWFESNLEAKNEVIPAGGGGRSPGEVGDGIGLQGGRTSFYLGLPLVLFSDQYWYRVEERFNRTLSIWKRQYISKGGRFMLIQSTLFNLPIQYMSLFAIPRRSS